MNPLLLAKFSLPDIICVTPDLADSLNSIKSLAVLFIKKKTFLIFFLLQDIYIHMSVNSYARTVGGDVVGVAKT